MNWDYLITAYVSWVARRKSITKASAAAIMLLVVPLANSSVTVPGKSEAGVNVLPSGQLNYSVPLSIPDGTNGLIPSVSLTYQSSQDNGLLGVGWSLSGTGAISRCSSNMAIDGHFSPIKFTQEDRFCLNGERLVLVAGAYGEDQSEYRTEIDTNKKIVISGSGVNGPNYFTVSTPEGKKYYYGLADDAKIKLRNSEVITTWAISKISDISSNYILYEYEQNNDRGEFHPIRISYTGNDNLSVLPYNFIDFYYSNRPDPQYQCTQGTLSQTDQRLVEVVATTAPEQADSESKNEIYRVYKLQYSDDGDFFPQSMTASACEANASEYDDTEQNPSDFQSILDDRYQSDLLYLQERDDLQDQTESLQERLDKISVEFENLLALQVQEIEDEIIRLEQLYQEAIVELDNLTPEQIEEKRAELTADRDLFEAEWLQEKAQIELDYQNQLSALVQGKLDLEQNQSTKLAEIYQFYKSKIAQIRKTILLASDSPNKSKHFQTIRSEILINAKSVVELSAKYYDEYQAEMEAYEISEEIVLDQDVSVTKRKLQAALTLSNGAYTILELYGDVNDLEPLIQKSIENHSYHLLFAGHLTRLYTVFVDNMFALYQSVSDEGLQEGQLALDTSLQDLQTKIAIGDAVLNDFDDKLSGLTLDGLTDVFNRELTALENYLDELNDTYGLSDLELVEIENSLQDELAYLDNLILINGLDRQRSYAFYQDYLDSLLSGSSGIEVDSLISNNGSLSSRSQLHTITECGYDGSCFAPLSFKWAAENIVWSSASSATPDALLSYDVLSTSGEGVSINLPDGLFGGLLGNTDADGGTADTPVDIDSLSPELIGLGRELAKSGQLVDVNNDGLMDWVLAFEESRGYQYLSTWINTGTGWQHSTEYTLPGAANNYKETPFGEFIDLNSDGFPEWVSAVELSNGDIVQKTFLNTQSGWQEDASMAFPGVMVRESETGHAKLGLFTTSNEGNIQWVSRAEDEYGYQEESLIQYAEGSWATLDSIDFPGITTYIDFEGIGSSGGELVDIQGDGTDEWVQYEELDSQLSVRVWKNQSGSFPTEPWVEDPNYFLDIGSTSIRGQFIDLNNDGLIDWVREIGGLDPNLGGALKVQLNTGSGWQDSADYANFNSQDIDIFDSNNDVISYLLDVDGDALPEIVRSLLLADDSVENIVLQNTGIGWIAAPQLELPRTITAFDDQNNVVSLGEFSHLSGDALLDWLNQYDIWNSDEHHPALINQQPSWYSDENYQLPVLEANWLSHLEQLIASLESGAFTNPELLAQNLLDDNGIPLVDEYGNPIADSDSANEFATGFAFDISEAAENGLQSGKLIDLNGDGRLDWIKAIRFNDSIEQRVAWIRQDSGWETSASFRPPGVLLDFTGPVVAQLIDLNADGLPDWLESYSTGSGADSEDIQRVWRNTGNGWIKDASLHLPRTLARLDNDTFALTAVLADVNMDGLFDILADNVFSAEDSADNDSWVSSSNGWQQDNTHNIPGSLLGYMNGSASTGGFFVDIDGDSFSDWVATDEFGTDIWLYTPTGWLESTDYELPIAAVNESGQKVGQFIDLNSDGLNDWVVSYRREDGSEYRSSWINTGLGWHRADSYILPGPLYQLGKGTLATLLDINQDGHLDFIQSLDLQGIGLHQSVWLNTGFGWVKPLDVSVPETLVRVEEDGSIVVENMLVDIDGDQNADLLSAYEKQGDSHANEYRLSNNGISGIVFEFDNGSYTDQIDYVKGYKASVVSSDTERAYPMVATNGPSLVVQGHQIEFDQEIIHHSSYTYEDFAVDLSGRGLLGFAKVQAIDEFTGIASSTEFRQDFPFIGQPSYSETSQWYGYGSILQSSEKFYSLVNTATSSIAPMPKIATKVTRNFDLDGDLVSEYQQDMESDTYGFPVQSVETIDEGGEQITISTDVIFTHDNDQWILGKTSRATVVKSNGLDTQSRFSTYTYNTENRLASKTSGIKTESFDYDGFGNQISVSLSASDVPSTQTTQYEFDARGRHVIKTIDVSAREMEYEYHSVFDQPTKVIYPDLIQAYGDDGSEQLVNKTVGYKFDAFGRKSRELQPNDVSQAYGYRYCTDACPEGAKNLVVMIDNDGQTPETVYYNGLGQEVRRATASADGRLVIVDISYDRRGNVGSKSLPYYEGDPIYAGQFTYDVLGRRIQTTNPDGSIQRQIYKGRTTTQINERGYSRVIQKNYMDLPVSISDQLGGSTQYEYDAFGQLTKTIDAHGNEVVIEYDTWGNKTQIDDPDHGISTFEYDGLNRATSKTNALSQTTNFVYDAFGRMTQRIEPEGSTLWEYSTHESYFGKLEKVTAPDGYQVEYGYDNIGRPIEETVTLPEDITIPPAFGRSRTKQTRYYGNSSAVMAVEYPNGFGVRNIYNGLGYLTDVKSGGVGIYDQYTATHKEARHNSAVLAEIQYTQAEDLYEAEIAPRVTVYEREVDLANSYFRQAQNIGKKINALADKADYYFTKSGNAMQQLIAYGRSLGAELNQIEDLKAQYAEAGMSYNPLKMEQEPIYIKRKSAYDNCFDAARDAVLASGGTIRDGDGSAWDINHGACASQYNAFENARYEVVDYYIAIAESNKKKGLSVADQIDDLRPSLDKAASKGNDHLRAANDIQEELDPLVEERNGYITAGNGFNAKAKVLYALAEQLYYLYVEETNITYWSLGDQDASNRALVTYLGNGVETTQTYNPTGYLTSRYSEHIDRTSLETQSVQSHAYAYDSAGNLLLRNNGLQQTFDAFSYDGLDRLVSADYSFLAEGQTVSEQFHYDAIGNITFKSGIGDYQYDNGRPHAVASTDHHNYVYDAGGNMINLDTTQVTYNSFAKPETLTDGADVIDFHYDGNRGRYYQRSVQSGEETETFYFFKGEYEEIIDGDGIRHISYIRGGSDVIAQVTGSVNEGLTDYFAQATDLTAHTQTFLDELVDEEAITSLLDVEYIVDLAALIPFITAEMLLEQEDDDPNAPELPNISDVTLDALSLIDIVFFHRDHLGSVTSMTNGSGELVSLQHYDAFGKAIYDVAEDATGYHSFSQHESLDIASLVHMNGRLFDPSVGRFLSADPFIPELYDSQSLNRYSYVYNNPLKYTDLDGYQPSLSDLDLKAYIFTKVTNFYLDMDLDLERDLAPILHLTRHDPGAVNQRLDALGITAEQWESVKGYANEAAAAWDTAAQIRIAKNKAQRMMVAQVVIMAVTAGMSAAMTPVHIGMGGGLAATYSATTIALTTTALTTAAQHLIYDDLDWGEVGVSFATAYVGVKINANYSGNARLTRMAALNGISKGITYELRGGEFKRGLGTGILETLADADMDTKLGEFLNTAGGAIIGNILIQGLIADINGGQFKDGAKLGLYQGTMQVAGIYLNGGSYSERHRFGMDYRALGTTLNLIVTDAPNTAIFSAGASALFGLSSQEIEFEIWFDARQQFIQEEFYDRLDGELDPLAKVVLEGWESGQVFETEEERLAFEAAQLRVLEAIGLFGESALAYTSDSDFTFQLVNHTGELVLTEDTDGNLISLDRFHEEMARFAMISKLANLFPGSKFDVSKSGFIDQGQIVVQDGLTLFHTFDFSTQTATISQGGLDIATYSMGHDGVTEITYIVGGDSLFTPTEVASFIVGSAIGSLVIKGVTFGAATLWSKYVGWVGSPSGVLIKLTVPNGGLKVHEAAGGHLIDRHVGKSASELINRSNGVGGVRAPIGGSSSYGNIGDAEHYTANILSKRQVDIDGFIQSGQSAPKFFDVDFGVPTGGWVSNGGSSVQTVTGARVVIVPDSTMPAGYRILTGYPIPKTYVTN